MDAIRQKKLMPRGINPARFFEAGTGAVTHVAALGALVAAGVIAYALAAQITGAMRLSTLRRGFSRA